jgi:hypothetical protein
LSPRPTLIEPQDCGWCLSIGLEKRGLNPQTAENQEAEAIRLGTKSAPKPQNFPAKRTGNCTPMLAICSPTPLHAGFVGDMSYPQRTSHHHHDSHADGHSHPHRPNHPYLTPSYTPSPWESPDPSSLEYSHFNQWNNLAYRPRLDGYPFTNPQGIMASPVSGTEPPSASASHHHTTPTGEYPEDPSFETGEDGRVEMGQDEIDAIIRNKRKVRDPKACYACHRRKVR